MENDESRPAVLYVEKLDTQPEVEQYLNTRRVAVIDLEIPVMIAVALTEHIRERNSKGATGSIRVRFTGRLIHL